MKPIGTVEPVLEIWAMVHVISCFLPPQEWLLVASFLFPGTPGPVLLPLFDSHLMSTVSFHLGQLLSHMGEFCYHRPPRAEAWL